MLRLTLTCGLIAAHALLLSACGSTPTNEVAASNTPPAADDKVCVTGSYICRKGGSAATGVKSISGEAMRSASEANGAGPSH